MDRSLRRLIARDRWHKRLLSVKLDAAAKARMALLKAAVDQHEKPTTLMGVPIVWTQDATSENVVTPTTDPR